MTHGMRRLARMAAAAAFGLGLSPAAEPAVIATPGGYEVSYAIDINGTLNGNPITSMVILETDGTQFSASYGFTAASYGATLLSHSSAFRPTAALVIGRDRAAPNLGDGKTHLVMLMDVEFTAGLGGKKFGEAFPAVGGKPKFGHDALIAAILAAETGDATAQQTVADFFLTGAGAFAAFDPAGAFRVGEFTVFVPIDVPEPASASSWWADHGAYGEAAPLGTNALTPPARTPILPSLPDTPPASGRASSTSIRPG